MQLLPDLMRNLSMDRFHIWMVVGNDQAAELKRAEVHFPLKTLLIIIITRVSKQYIRGESPRILFRVLSSGKYVIIC